MEETSSQAQISESLRSLLDWLLLLNHYQAFILAQHEKASVAQSPARVG